MGAEASLEGAVDEELRRCWLSHDGSLAPNEAWARAALARPSDGRDFVR